MAQVTKTRTYLTGNQLTATNYNDDRDEIINGVNSINNSQIASDAAIAESKLSFNTSTGHDHDGSDSKKVLVTNLDVTGLTAGQVLKVNSGGTAVTTGGAGRAFAWGFVGTITTGNTQGMQFIAPQALTVTNLRAKTTSGSCTIRIKTDSTDIDSTASVTSTAGNITSFDSTAITAGQVVTLDVLTVSSAVDLFVTLECS